jgi:hypothetical protein
MEASECLKSYPAHEIKEHADACDVKCDQDPKEEWVICACERSAAASNDTGAQPVDYHPREEKGDGPNRDEKEVVPHYSKCDGHVLCPQWLESDRAHP